MGAILADPDPNSIPAPRNRLLASLPPDVLTRIWSLLDPVEVSQRQVLQRTDEPITSVYFPESGWVSMLCVLADGAAAEIGLVGREGMIGLPLLLGSDRGSAEGMVQSPGTMMRMEARVFLAELDRTPVLRTILLRYTLVLYEQVSQTAACNGHHALDQRLARWLLMGHDRADGDDFPMTQEFLALMLCVHRPGVTLAARYFQQAGLVRYAHGRITITDRAGLEEAACECYAAVRTKFARLLESDVG
jgi:CRP-like cAMP-binding protein